ncbi:hypothetical protein RCL1_003512 [Eukaryota sp. TZLM3-RCL]
MSRHSLSNFKLLKTFHRCDRGQTLLVENESQNLFCAKIVHDSSKTSLEAQILLKNLSSPFLVPLYDCFYEGQQFVLIMEYLNDGSLNDFLKTQQLTNTDVWIIATQLLHALNYLHERNIIHGNLKPANVLLCSVQRPLHVKRCDFGLSKDCIESSTKFMTGTVEFMAPEVLKGQLYDTSIDLWSLGILIYFLVHGEYPFNSVDEILNSEIPISNSEFGPITSKLLVRDPASRATAADLLLDPKIIEISEDFIKDSVLESTSDSLSLKSSFEDQSNLISHFLEVLPVFSYPDDILEEPEEQVRENEFTSTIKFICKYPSEVYSRFGNRTKFIGETKGSCLELSNDDCLVRSMKNFNENSFIAINHPLNGRITLTLRIRRSDDWFSSFIGYFNPNKCQDNSFLKFFTGIQLCFRGTNFSRLLRTYGSCEYNVTSAILPSQSVVISFTNNIVTYSTPHSGWSRTVDCVDGWVFGISLFYEGELWSIE